MGIDTSIYQSLKPYEAPSMEDAQQKAMSLSQMGMQQAHAMKQMQREDRADTEAQQKKALMAIGGGIEHIMGLPEDQQPAAYKQIRESLIAQNVISPNDAPEDMDPQHLKGMYYQLNTSPEWLQIKKSQAELANAKNDPVDRALARKKTQAEINELNSKAGKYNADAKSSGSAPAGKIVRGPEAVSLGQASSAVKELDDYEKTLNSVSDIGGKNAGALIAGIQGKLQLGEDGKRAAAVDTAADKVTQVMGTYLQHGVLDHNTFERYKAMIPSRYDEPEVAANKLKTLKNLIAQRQNEELAALKQTGYDVSSVPMLQGPGHLEVPKKSGGSTDLVPSANAESGGVKMIGPDGKIRMIPKDQVGEAIAAGGKKVN